MQVAVYEVGFKSNCAESWTTTAASELGAAVQRQLAASPEFDFVPALVLSGERLAAVQAFLATASLVELSVNGIWDFSTDWPNAPVRHELGPSLSFIADETGSEYALPSFEASMATMLLVRASDHARISSETAASPD